VSKRRAAGPRREAEIGPLLLSLFFGFAINLLTAETGDWWGPLQPLARYPWIWVPASTVVWIGWLLRRRRRTAITWRSSESPYPGLASFDATRAAVFFGREPEIEKILTRLDRSGISPQQRFLVLVGPSGSGKTSILQAGVLPRLGKRWHVRGPLRPVSLAHGPRKPDERQPRLWVIDQWEDVYTLSGDEERTRLLELLRDALTDDPDLRILTAMRPEYYATAVAESPELFGAAMPIGPLGPQQIRDAIERPAEAAGVTFEDGLVNVMVVEATVGDALPLLGHLLQQLFLGAKGRTVTNAAYDQAGRVGGAIARHADAVYRSLLGERLAQETVDRTLLRGVGLERDQTVRRPIARAGLDPVGQQVLEEFRSARLLVDVHDGQDYEFAHEAVFRQWGTLADLVAANADQLRQVTLLEHRAAAWQSSGLDDELLRGKAIDSAVRSVLGLATSSVLDAFLRASRSVDDAVSFERADQLAAVAQQMAERDLELGTAIAAAVVREVAASPAAKLTLWGLTTRPAVSRLLLGHSSAITSMVWSATGGLRSADGTGRVCDWDEAEHLTGLKQVQGSGSADGVVLSPDGEQALVTVEGGCELWRVNGERRIFRRISDAAFMLSKHSWAGVDRLLLSDDFSTLGLYRLRDDDPERVAEIPARATSCVGCSPSGDRVAFVAGDSLEIWSIDSSAELVFTERSSSEFPAVLLWSPDGRRFAVSGPRRSRREMAPISEWKYVVRIHDLTGGLLTEWETREGGPFAWSPDGSMIAGLNRRNQYRQVEIRDAATGGVIRRRVREDWVTAISWSADGRKLAVGLSTGTIDVWNLPQNRIGSLLGGSLGGVSWSPGKQRAVATRRRSAPVIVSMVDEPAVLDSDTEIDDVRWSPVGDSIAGCDGTALYLWSSRDSRMIGKFPDDSKTANRLAWSPDGSRIALQERRFMNSGDEDCRLSVWNVADRAIEAFFIAGRQIAGVAWSPHGELIAGIVADEIAVWRAATGEMVRRWPAADQLSAAVSWSPDGDLVAAAFGPRIWVWDFVSDAELAQCIGPTADVRVLAWSPDGTMLASSTNNQDLHLWDPRYGRRLATLIGRAPGKILDLSWAEELSATLPDGTIFSWVMPSPAVVPEVAGGRVLSEAERRRFGLPPALA